MVPGMDKLERFQEMDKLQWFRERFIRKISKRDPEITIHTLGLLSLEKRRLFPRCQYYTFLNVIII